ncbi:OmpA family protein [candidate division WOR-3 bacterium]|nr:OmpA family protein [candidate division WOR-3 bacterium]
MKNLLVMATVTLFVATACAPTAFKQSGLVEVGTIYGFITDEKGLPIESAQVLVAGEKEYIIFTSAAGYYMLSDLAEGKYTVVVTKRGYEGQSVDIKADQGEEIEFNISLTRREQKTGEISGIVVDYQTSGPLIVDVMITELGLKTITDKAGSYHFIDLEPATYLLKFEAMDYITSHADASVQPGQNTEVMVRLIKAGTVFSFPNIQFEFGKATIKRESYEILGEVAAILTNQPEINVEVQGHTDAIGSDEANKRLSQERAEAVRDHLIDIHMIEPIRLLPIGYGESQPVADNETDEERAKNRRVDFVVLEE